VTAASAVDETKWRAILDWRPLLLPIGLLVFFELVARVAPPETDFWPMPSRIVSAWLEALLDGSLIFATAQTLQATLGGLGTGIAIGLLLGIILGLLPTIDRLLAISIETIRPIPPTAIIPIALLVWGIGLQMEMAIAAFSATWPILIFTRGAIRGVEPRLIEVSRILRLGFVRSVWKIVLPAALPRIFVAIRLAAAVSLIVCVTVEVTANPYGLGNAMREAQQALRPEMMFAYLVWIGIVGWFFNGAIVWLQKRMVRPPAKVTT